VRKRLERYQKLLEIERDEGVLKALDALIRELAERDIPLERGPGGAILRTSAKRHGARRKS
jgi:hypothetical protein